MGDITPSSEPQRIATRTSSPVPSTSSYITSEPAENNFMELSESAIYDDTGVSILFVQGNY